MLRSMARTARSLTLLSLFVTLVAGCVGTTTPVQVEETFLSTAIAVIVPAPAHSGDTVTVIVKPNPVYQPGNPEYNISFTGALYGPFPSFVSEQTAIASSTVGPPVWQNRLSGVSGGGSVSNGGNLVSQSTTTLPTTLAPGYYDLAVTVSLSGSRAMARSDTVVQIVSRS